MLMFPVRQAVMEAREARKAAAAEGADGRPVSGWQHGGLQYHRILAGLLRVVGSLDLHEVAGWLTLLRQPVASPLILPSPFLTACVDPPAYACHPYKYFSL